MQMTRLAGRVDTPYLQSTVLQGNLPGDPVERMLPVYLPPGYDENPTKRYPVIYVLAGHGGRGPLMLASSAWGESFPERIDRLIRTEAMPPVIAVLPDCWTIFGGAQYINSTALGRYEDYLTDELIPEEATRLVHQVGDDGQQPELALEFARAHLDALLAKVGALGGLGFDKADFHGSSGAVREQSIC